MLFYIEPIIVLLNGVHNELNFSRVDMLGFSAGGWIATVAAAVDRRISQTITVAGGYPLYLRLKISNGSRRRRKCSNRFFRRRTILKCMSSRGREPRVS